MEDFIDFDDSLIDHIKIDELQKILLIVRIKRHYNQSKFNYLTNQYKHMIYWIQDYRELLLKSKRVLEYDLTLNNISQEYYKNQINILTRELQFTGALLLVSTFELDLQLVENFQKLYFDTNLYSLFQDVELEKQCSELFPYNQLIQNIKKHQQFNSLERNIMIMRFGLDGNKHKTIEETANELIITPEEVEEIEIRLKDYFSGGM